MAIKGLDLNPTEDVSALAITTTGSEVTKTLMIQYDDSKAKPDIMEALEKAKLALIKHLSGLT